MTRHKYPTHEEMVLRLLGHLEDAEDATLADGGAWYVEARRHARRLARAYGLTLSQVAGVVAALSPRVHWATNLRLAENVCRDGIAGTGSLRANADKAWRIWSGENALDVLGGPKVRAFYRCIMGDTSAAVLDTWMWYALDWPEGGSTSGRQYERAAEALREAASVASLPVSELQAIIWTHVRGRAA